MTVKFQDGKYTQEIQTDNPAVIEQVKDFLFNYGKPKTKKAVEVLNRCKRWTDNEIADVLTLSREGKTPKTIGEIMGRSAASISTLLWNEKNNHPANYEKPLIVIK